VYRWEFNTADDELAALLIPSGGQKALADLLNALVFDPHDYARTPGEPIGKSLRTLPFADDDGLVIVNILDRDRLVVVVQVDWIG
jgi:hypothetical protein